MELAHSSFAEEVDIHDCTFNMGLSLVGHDEYTGPSYSFNIYHNHLDVIAGRWIELTTSRMRIHHNYFTGKHSGTQTFNSYNPELDQGGLVIHHNIFEFASGALFGLQGSNGIVFANNTVIWAPHQDSRKIPYLANFRHDNSGQEWQVFNNLFLSPDDRTGSMWYLRDGAVAPDLQADRNWAPHFDIPGNSAPSGDHGLALDGAKPDPWWRLPASSPLVDAGVVVAGVSDAAVGAPDIGAWEVGGDNRFLPDDFSWPILPAQEVAVLPGLDTALYDFADDSASMLDDIREVIGTTPDATGVSELPDNLQVLEVDPEGNYCAAIFEGFIVAPSTGLYRFWLTSEDGSRLQLHERDILENDGWHSELTVSDVVRLEAGLHPVRILYASWWGSPQAMRLEWRPPGESRQDMVAADFVRTDPAPPANSDPVISSVGAEDDPVTTTSTRLRVMASDADGDPLTVSWSVVDAPVGASPVIGDGEDPTVTFVRAGSYRFAVTVSDGRGGSASDGFDLVVEQSPGGLQVAP